MGHPSYVCGFIKVKEKERALEAISRLPKTREDAQWPFLTASMFSHTETSSYRDIVIHFAASFKDILGDWDEWESKFETFLSEFNHEGAKVFIEDCYKGDFIVAWFKVFELETSVPKIEKIHRYLDYMNTPEVDLM
jgi:hypothetical protein